MRVSGDNICLWAKLPLSAVASEGFILGFFAIKLSIRANFLALLSLGELSSGALGVVMCEASNRSIALKRVNFSHSLKECF